MSDDWKRALKADPTDWLMEPDDPGVRYLALRDIVDANEKEVKAARRKAHREGPIAVILDNMDPAGWWIQPDHVYYPKFQGTAHSIVFLAQLGGSVDEDERIKTACSYLLDRALLKGGQFVPKKKPTDFGLCLQGNMLACVMELGFEDKRLDTAYEWMARRVTGEDLPRKINDDGLTREQGGSAPFFHRKFITDPLFGCRTNDGLSCGYAATLVLLAFSRLPEERRTGLVTRAIDAGVNFFLSGDPSKAEFPGHRKGTPNTMWWQFSFPAGTDILRIAEALTALGYGTDPRLANTLKFILEKQDSDGRWLIDYHFRPGHKTWVKFGPAGIPSKWVTLRALRVLKQAEEQKH